MFDFSNYSSESKFYEDSNKLVEGNMKYETGSVTIKEFVGLNPKMYSILVWNSSKHRKAKNMSKNVVETINHSEYKNVLLNNKCLRHVANRIQSKDHRIRTYEPNKIYLFCFDNKIHIPNNGYNGLRW